MCITHVAFSNMGLTKEALSDASLSLGNPGSHMHDRMTHVGNHMNGLLSSKLGIGAQFSEGDPESPPPGIRHRDMKARRLYDPIVRRVAPGRSSVSLLLPWVLSRVNTARLLVPSTAARNEAAAFKVRFVSLYRAALSLHGLLEEQRAHAFLLPDALKRIADVLGSDPVRSVLGNRLLRDDLFHYGVVNRIAPRLDPRLPLFGLVEAHANGRSFATVASDLELGLRRVPDGLRGLLPRLPAPRGPA